MDIKRIMLLVCLSMLLGTAVMAEPSGGSPSDSVKAGPWALLFGVTKNFSLAPFAGTEFWIQRGLPSGDGLRVGVRVTAGSASGSGYYVDVDGDSIDVMVAAHHVHYKQMDGDLSFLYGAGPIIRVGSMSSHESEWAENDTLFIERQWRREGDSWSAGVEVLVGAEWQLTRHIALSADYSSSLIYTSRDRDVVWRERSNDGPWEIRGEDHPHFHGWSTGDLLVRLGLVIYL